MKVSIIVAMSENGVIGVDNALHWHLPKDFEMLKQRTAGKPLVMGRKTHESIGRPLPGRLNVVVTRNENYRSEGCVVVSSLLEGLGKAQDSGQEELFIFGGSQIYKQVLDLGLVDVMYITEIHQKIEGDSFFPEWDKGLFDETERVSNPAEGENPAFDFVTYVRKQ